MQFWEKNWWCILWKDCFLHPRYQLYDMCRNNLWCVLRKRVFKEFTRKNICHARKNETYHEAASSPSCTVYADEYSLTLVRFMFFSTVVVIHTAPFSFFLIKMSNSIPSKLLKPVWNESSGKCPNFTSYELAILTTFIQPKKKTKILVCRLPPLYIEVETCMV